jgi:hypothetical protein
VHRLVERTRTIPRRNLVLRNAKIYPIDFSEFTFSKNSMSLITVAALYSALYSGFNVT